MTFVDLKSVTVYRQNIVNIIAQSYISHESNDIIQIKTFTVLTRKSLGQLKTTISTAFNLPSRLSREKRETREE